MKTSLKYETDLHYRAKVQAFVADVMAKKGHAPITKIDRRYMRMLPALAKDESFNPDTADIYDAAKFLMEDTIRNGSIVVKRGEKIRELLNRYKQEMKLWNRIKRWAKGFQRSCGIILKLLKIILIRKSKLSKD